jgi:hypothetical protein
VGLAEFANSRQAVPCIRRNRFVRPCPTERTLRSAHGPDHANIACYFTGLIPEHQLRFIKAPLIRASCETVTSNHAALRCCMRRTASWLQADQSGSVCIAPLTFYPSLPSAYQPCV